MPPKCGRDIGALDRAAAASMIISTAQHNHMNNGYQNGRASVYPIKFFQKLGAEGGI